MELATAVLLRDGVDPVAVSLGGEDLLHTEAWTRLYSAAQLSLSRDPSEQAISVLKPGGNGTWLVYLLPMYDPATRSNGSHLLLVFDPESEPRIQLGSLQAMFRLTKAEARLVEQLLMGRTPAEAAEALGVTIHTVRTYLKRLYGKLGVSSQALLMRKLLQAVSLPLRPAA